MSIVNCNRRATNVSMMMMMMMMTFKLQHVREKSCLDNNSRRDRVVTSLFHDLHKCDKITESTRWLHSSVAMLPVHITLGWTELQDVNSLQTCVEIYVTKVDNDIIAHQSDEQLKRRL